MQAYYLPATYMGLEHVAVLDHPVTSTALSIPRLHEGPVLCEVTLESDALTGGWRIRCPYGFIGVLDGTEAAEMPDLERLRTSSVIPTTWATVELFDSEVEVAVHLGLWPWTVARNNLPAGAILLHGGQGHRIDTSAGGDLNTHQLKELGTCQLFSHLTVIDGAVVASVEGHVLGSLDCPSHVPAIIKQAAQQGSAVYARTYVADSLMAVDLPPADSAEPFAAPVPPLSTPHSGGIIPPAHPVDPADESWDFDIDAELLEGDFPAPHGPRRFKGLVHQAKSDIVSPGLENESPDLEEETTPGPAPEEASQQPQLQQPERPGGAERSGGAELAPRPEQSDLAAPQPQPSGLVDATDLVSQHRRGSTQFNGVSGQDSASGFDAQLRPDSALGQVHARRQSRKQRSRGHHRK